MFNNVSNQPIDQFLDEKHNKSMSMKDNKIENCILKYIGKDENVVIPQGIIAIDFHNKQFLMQRKV